MPVHHIALVDSRIVEQDDTRHGVRLVGYPIEEGDDVIACGRPLLRSPYQLSVMAQCAEHVDPLSVGQWLDGARFADSRPAILDCRVRTETRFVEIQQFTTLLMIESAQFPNYPAGAFEGLLVAFFLNRNGSACS